MFRDVTSCCFWITLTAGIRLNPYAYDVCVHLLYTLGIIKNRCTFLKIILTDTHMVQFPMIKLYRVLANKSRSDLLHIRPIGEDKLYLRVCNTYSGEILIVCVYILVQCTLWL